MDNVNLEVLMRYHTLDYLNVGSTEEEEYDLMGGFTKIDYSASPKVDKSAYVHDVNATSTITGYEASFPFECARIIGNKANEHIQKVGLDQKTGKDAETMFVRVEMKKPISTGADGEYEARKYYCTIEAAEFTGEATEKQVVSGTLHQNGDFTPGKFNIKTKTFTPDEAGE